MCFPSFEEEKEEEKEHKWDDSGGVGETLPSQSIALRKIEEIKFGKYFQCSDMECNTRSKCEEGNGKEGEGHKDYFSVICYTASMSRYRTLDDLKDCSGKTVLVRVDHNVTCDEKGVPKDDQKLRVTIPTIEFLLKKKAKVILMTHVGRPKGKVDETLRTGPIAMHLKTLSKSMKTVKTMREVIGPSVESATKDLKPGEVLYLENVRFHPGEEKNDPAFIETLTSIADYYVNEAFPSLHIYEEASTCGVARKLPAFAGFHLLKEVEHLGKVIEDPRRPLVLIMSGAKMETKIPVIERFLDIADDILLGGCIANTFIAARGFNVGKSKYEDTYLAKAQEFMLESEKEEKADIHVPRDAVVATNADAQAAKIDLPVEDIEGDMAIFDIGGVTVQRYVNLIQKAGSVIWNGPLGLCEVEEFSHASKRMAEAILSATKDRGIISIVGGGDTIDFHTRYGYDLGGYTFVSMGGGAMLEFLSGTLPALEILKKD